MSWREVWSFSTPGSLLSASISQDGAEIAIGITNTVAMFGVSNSISPAEARKLAAALIEFADAATTYRGWTITQGRWPEPAWRATGPNYDASYEGEEDGWISNGECADAPTRDGLIAEIDAWFEEHGE